MIHPRYLHTLSCEVGYGAWHIPQSWEGEALVKTIVCDASNILRICLVFSTIPFCNLRTTCEFSEFNLQNTLARICLH